MLSKENKDWIEENRKGVLRLYVERDFSVAAIVNLKGHGKKEVAEILKGVLKKQGEVFRRAFNG